MSRRPLPSKPALPEAAVPKDRGMTLIELVVAMAIFALVAVMGLQGLSGMLRIRDRLSEVDETTRALSRAVALMRNDLTALVPIRFFAPGREVGALPLDWQEEEALFALSLGGQTDAQAARPGGHFQRAEWRLDAQSGTLERRIWRGLTPADTSTQTPWMPVLENVSTLSLRSYWGSQGWLPGVENPMMQAAPQRVGSDDDAAEGAAPVENYSAFVPLAVEVTLVTETRGEIRLLETYR